jgi:hypothetical protein
MDRPQLAVKMRTMLFAAGAKRPDAEHDPDLSALDARTTTARARPGRRLGHDLHDPGYAGGARLGRQDAAAAAGQILDDQSRRQALYVQAARRRHSSAAARSSLRPTSSTASSASWTRPPSAVRPGAWASIKDLRAPIPTTVEYELNEPFSDLLVQLAMFNNTIHNKESVDAAGQGLRHQGHRRHRALVLGELAAAHQCDAQAPRRL